MSAPAFKVPARWWRYAKRRRITCPAGHHIPEDQNIPEHGFVRCKHWCTDGRSRGHECGHWVFILAIRGGGTIIAQVELNEMRAMEDLSTPTAMLDYLGIFPQ